MRTSLIVSAFLHLILLAVVLINISSSRRPDTSHPVAVEILNPSDLSRSKAGTPDKQEAAAAPKALPEEKAAEAPTTTQPDPKPVEKATKKQAALPPPPKQKATPLEPPVKREKPDMTPQEKADAAIEPAEEQPKPKPIPPKRADPKPEKSAEAPPAPSPAMERKPKPENRPEPKRPPSQPDHIAGLLNQPPRVEPRRWEASHEETPPDKSKRFDPNRIAALLNRDPTAGQQPAEDGPKQPWRRPSSLQDQATGMTPGASARSSYGTPSGRDDRMSSNEIDAFIAQIARCWTPPVGGLGGEAIVVKLHIELNEDGTVARPPQVANGLASPFFTPAADSAVRAVLQCQPYRMPVDKFNLWRDMMLNFDPKEMYGG